MNLPLSLTTCYMTAISIMLSPGSIGISAAVSKRLVDSAWNPLAKALVWFAMPTTKQMRCRCERLRRLK